MNQEKQAVDLSQGIKAMKDNMPALIEHITLMAQLGRRKYNELIKQGFSEQQALVLCQKTI